MIEITPGVSISEHELTFTYDRSPGPGGQNANKVNTRVTLIFDVKKSMSLSNQQKNHLRNNLTTRINQDGILRISSSKERTQLANRRAAINRFVDLLSKAFRKQKLRKKTHVPAAAKQKRLDQKKQRGVL
ncbi:MAG: aminoacyl-tRNA hydrolase, partial [Planctomycetota bacterium]